MSTKTSVAGSGGYYYYSGGWHFKSWQYVNQTDRLISVEHPGWRSQSDGGGPFLLISTKHDISPGTINRPTCIGQVPLPTIVNQPSYTAPVNPGDSYGNSKGATAISRVLPTNPAAQLSTALGELTKDGLPSIIGSSAFKEQVRVARSAGDEYLNYEFGWLPLVSDLKKFAHAVKHRHEIMHGYLKYSDKQIRRRYDFPPGGAGPTSLSTTGYLDAQFGLPVNVSMNFDNKVEEWFSGSFRYHIPTPDQSKWGYYRAEASKILGLELTPEVVWNLAPWSWAVDWFTNTGDVIHNISRLGNDGLVMRYGYQMYKNVSTRDYVSTGFSPNTAGYSSHYRKTESVKIRWRASPYGFGITWNGLTDAQKAIVVALGLSRAF
jgi:hypothetical protein